MVCYFFLSWIEYIFTLVFYVSHLRMVPAADKMMLISPCCVYNHEIFFPHINQWKTTTDQLRESYLTRIWRLKRLCFFILTFHPDLFHWNIFEVTSNFSLLNNSDIWICHIEYQVLCLMEWWRFRLQGEDMFVDVCLRYLYNSS